MPPRPLFRRGPWRTGVPASAVPPHPRTPRTLPSLPPGVESNINFLAARAFPNSSRQRAARSFSSFSTSALSSSSASMEPDVRAAIESLHAQKSHKIVVYATGGAAQVNITFSLSRIPTPFVFFPPSLSTPTPTCFFLFLSSSTHPHPFPPPRPSPGS